MPSRKSSSESKSPRSSNYEAALTEFGDAMSVFAHKHDWSGAARAFEAFVERHREDEDVSELVDRARTHLHSCQQRLQTENPTPTDGQGWLLEAVVRANEGNLDGSLEAFDKALADGAEEAKVYYARATALAAGERSDEAISSLAKAIELDPENRAFALGDPDFERLREHHGFVELVEPPQSGSSSEGEVHGSEGGEFQEAP